MIISSNVKHGLLCIVWSDIKVWNFLLAFWKYNLFQSIYDYTTSIYIIINRISEHSLSK